MLLEQREGTVIDKEFSGARFVLSGARYWFRRSFLPLQRKRCKIGVITVLARFKEVSARAVGGERNRERERRGGGEWRRKRTTASATVIVRSCQARDAEFESWGKTSSLGRISLQISLYPFLDGFSSFR